MPPIRNITQVTLDNLHEHIPEYIHGNKLIIQNYDDMKNVYLQMLKNRYLFTIDRDILVPCLIDLTYMFCPGDDLNKDAVVDLLELQDDEDDGGECSDSNSDSCSDNNDTHYDDENNTIHSLISLSSTMDDENQMECENGM